MQSDTQAEFMLRPVTENPAQENSGHVQLYAGTHIRALFERHALPLCIFVKDRARRIVGFEILPPQ